MTITLFIIISTAIVSFICFSNKELFWKLSFRPSEMNQPSEYHRLLTHAFVHADWMHLILNMFVLWSFGSAIENIFIDLFDGKAKMYYIFLYFGAIPFAALPSLMKHGKNYAYSSVGASGAVSAIVFSSIIINPLGKIYLFMIPIGIPSFIFGILYLIYSAWMAKRSSDNIDHNAHFAGAVYGILLTIVLEPRLIDYFIYQIQSFFS